ncbi:hypothetical protein D8B26_007909 [Coccidioides posadasii str. Silveira]|uniref:uncharacterized protein n=1 Tax=Coccidioides posadasii (strain RMSCC 757 / Silveira) TaxID=443226 RepID=UPI001BEEA619|nr:hypothetical protein D8B26_007909 [Coccidioides posadasii str. Silveira]
MVEMTKEVISYKPAPNNFILFVLISQVAQSCGTRKDALEWVLTTLSVPLREPTQRTLKTTSPLASVPRGRPRKSNTGASVNNHEPPASTLLRSKASPPG